MSKPSIILLLTDDQGWADVGYARELYQPGAGGVAWRPNPPRTPKLDEMAAAPGTIVFHRFCLGCTRFRIKHGRQAPHSGLRHALPTHNTRRGAWGCSKAGSSEVSGWP